MNRAEQIQKAANLYAGGLINQYGFKAGAVWADAHPMNTWISIDVQLPKVGTLVLWKSYRDMLVAYRDEHNCINYNGGYFGTIHSLELDYWMPIPEMQKGGE